MDISIIFVNFNTKEAVYEAVKSCLEEGSKIKKEIIIIDNGSADGSYEYLTEKFKNNRIVILIHNKENLGFSKAVNSGLKRSKGEYKYLLNSDTKVTTHAFTKIIEFSKTDKKIGVIGTKLILPDGSTQKSCFNLPSVINAISEYWFGKRGSFTPFYKNSASIVDAVVGASFAITPEAYNNIGLFDERYFMYYEDLDYCRRIKKAGFKVMYYPEVSVFHHHGLSGETIADNANQWRRLVLSSKIYHGVLIHSLITFVLWSGKKWRSIMERYENKL
jgi:GT2 family glycosyltransferase